MGRIGYNDDEDEIDVIRARAAARKAQRDANAERLTKYEQNLSGT